MRLAEGRRACARPRRRPPGPLLPRPPAVRPAGTPSATHPWRAGEIWSRRPAYGGMTRLVAVAATPASVIIYGICALPPFIFPPNRAAKTIVSFADVAFPWAPGRSARRVAHVGARVQRHAARVRG